MIPTRAFTTTFVVLAASLLASAPAQAAPGDLDLTFSDDGVQITDFGGAESGSGVAVQADGRIVVAGRRDGDFVLARYNSDGSLDSSLSGDGVQATDFGATAYAGGVVIQADGRIVAAGQAGSDFALARYNSDGSLDTAFSGDGMQTTDFDGGYDFAQGVAVQADGIVVAGSSLPSDASAGFGDFALARYDANGSLDTSFGAGGKQTTDFDVEDHGQAVAVQADGKIVVAGTSAPERSAPDLPVKGRQPQASRSSPTARSWSRGPRR
jgi:uncharacterized delta-60 repeat protein